jgi:oxygen-independent coproporphyrinogen-3 oxidase
MGFCFSINPRYRRVWFIAFDQGKLPVWRGLALSFDDRVRAEVIQQLMCNAAIDVDAIEERHDVDFAEYFAEAYARLAPLEADGLVEYHGRRIVATPRGRLLLRIIAMCFDRHLDLNAAAARPRYSRVI